MLILFDIDATLLRTNGAGLRAMEDAGRELFGSHFAYDGIDAAGRLDTHLWAELAARNHVPDTSANHDRFRAVYSRLLEARLADGWRVERMPGVAELIDELRRIEHVTLGLLTGNYPETGRMKVRGAGLDPDHFVANAWGCDGWTRRDLPPVAMRAHRQVRGQAIEPGHVVIIGDTPLDIDCARHNGCRSLGVATGQFSVEALRDAGADLAVANLADTSAMLKWLIQH